MSRRHTGMAAILAGALYFAGQGGELVFDTPEGLWATLGIGGFVALAVAVWGLRRLVGSTRTGRVGIRTALVGVGFLCLFSVQLAVELVRTGEIPDNFVLFLIAFLLILVGQLLYARDLRPVVGRAWLAPIVAVVGLAMALFLDPVGLHDVGLFVFEAAWVWLGVALVRRPRTELPAAAPAAES
jgi:drug/metabolite transporter (DMT)-like permease